MREGDAAGRGGIEVGKQIEARRQGVKRVLGRQGAEGVGVHGVWDKG